MIKFTKAQKNKIDKDYEVSVKLAEGRKYDLFQALERCDETEAYCFKFLLAYLPMTDLTNYDGEFFYNHVHSCLANIEKVSWKDEIDTETFLNFILVPRINNENLEHYNQIIFDEVYPLIKDKTLEEAIVEVAIWCVSRATYSSTDIRTVSPLTMMRNTNGRCGEESTFETSALRACCIPARQCYTPRWTASDSNHAWVEVLVKGQWHFIGGCEPDPFLDTGWYVIGATQAMLTNNRIFSDFEPINSIFVKKTKRLKELNTLPLYAKTQNISVSVVENGKPKSGVRIQLSIINYGEIFDFLDAKTDKDGKVYMTTGFGDFLITASKGNKTLYSKIDVRLTDNVTLDWANAATFDKLPEEFDFDIIPPARWNREFTRPENAQEIIDKFNVKNKAANERRIAYKNTFYNENSDIALCKKYPDYANDIRQFLIDAQGNAHKIEAFIDDPKNIKDKVAFLKTLSRKDFGDCDNMILEKHFAHQMQYAEEYEDNRLTFERFVLAIRIANEWLSDYAPKIDDFFSDEQKNIFRADPQKIIEYVDEAVESSADIDYNALVALPFNLIKTKRADGISKQVLEVAIMRSLGIPARFTFTEEVEYCVNGDWYSMRGVELKKEQSAGLIPNAEGVDEAMRFVTLERYENGEFTMIPMFRRHKISGNGPVEDENTVRLRPGQYRVLTAFRIKNGGIQAKLYHFTLKDGEVKEMTFKVRPEKTAEAKDLRTAFDAEIFDKNGKAEKISKLTADKAVFAWLGTREEPTEHLFNEMLPIIDAYKPFAKNVYFILRNEKELNHVTLKKVLSALPEINIRYYKEIPSEMYDALGTDDKRLPLVIVTDKALKVYTISTGYNIGSAEQILKAVIGK